MDVMAKENQQEGLKAVVSGEPSTQDCSFVASLIEQVDSDIHAELI
jgi:hypothetical protein